jgi:hypothetical protein
VVQAAAAAGKVRRLRVDGDGAAEEGGRGEGGRREGGKSGYLLIHTHAAVPLSTLDLSTVSTFLLRCSGPDCGENEGGRREKGERDFCAHRGIYTPYGGGGVGSGTG